MSRRLLTYLVGAALSLTSCRTKQMEFNAADYFDGPARELAIAIQDNNLAKARTLLGGVELNRVYRDRMTFIMWAIINQRKQGLEWLLKQGANPNFADGDGTPPITYAAILPDIDYLRILLENGGDPNSKDNQQPATIGAALVDGDLWENVLLLLDKGANINAVNEGGQTLAMVYGNLNLFDKVAHLIDRGTDVYYVNQYGGTLAFVVDDANPNPASENYRWQQVVKTKLENKSIKFPAPKPWGVEGMKAGRTRHDE